MLSPGWNLVSFADIESISADEAFSSVEDFWSYIVGYDAITQRYSATITKDINSTTDLLDPRQGYWIFMNSTARMIGTTM